MQNIISKNDLELTTKKTKIILVDDLDAIVILKQLAPPRLVVR